uniref:F-box DNA helicase 1 isoform X2 n=1 Tax=Ciona intestinalis TaxID=7719 RepID=UPI000EF4C49A|nr:F-box DNA helicase 1 isoform X2 [Ciona intestinalis]|eukprot:XP_026690280.1 F-box DNA helicase 1 isoform X2 [Ciona intestinalis]
MDVTPSPSKRKQCSSSLLSGTPGKRLLFDHSQPCSSSQVTQVQVKTGLSSQASTVDLDSSIDLFDDDDEEFDNYVANLPDEVMDGSQPLPSMDRLIELDKLPDHVLENIFSCLPISDLIGTCPVVCKRWNNIIKSNNFLSWKKMYHKIRMNDKDSLLELESLMEHSNIGHSREQGDLLKPYVIVNLVRFMGNWGVKFLQSTELSEMVEQIERHQLFPLANALLEKKILSNDDAIAKQLLATNSPQIWMLASLILILSPDVKSTLHFHHVLSRALPLPLVMDFFYVIASLFWMLHLFQLTSQQSHYKVIASISIIENASSPIPLHYSKTEIQSQLVNNLTHEQLRVVNHDFQTGQLIRVMAYAGAGKTSTLIACVKAKPNKTFLYTSFCKAVVDEGKKVFYNHPNVRCATLHSLAYREMDMNRYRHKIDRRNSMSSHDIIYKLGLEKEMAFCGLLVRKTLILFMSSSDKQIKLRHVPRYRIKKEGDKYVHEDLSEDLRKSLQNLAVRYWKKITDFQGKECSISDDCYLKMWQMKNPLVSQYDVILLDEAQDCSECMRDILVKQTKHATLVLVGDSHQQIYGFRHARDALTLVRHTHSYYLTQSFRFGPEIAQVADALLRGFKFNGFAKTRLSPNVNLNSSISEKTLLGVGCHGTIAGEAVGKPYCVLCRTNLGVIKSVVSLWGEKKNEEKQIVVVGGAEKLNLGVILDLYALSIPMQQRRKAGIYIKSASVKKFQTLKQVHEDALLHEDSSMINNVEVVKLYGNRIPKIVQQLKNLPRNLQDADIVVSTVHKAKGLEFDTISLCDDFASHLLRHISIGNNPSPGMKEEANLLYVAATRPRKSLILSPTLSSLLKQFNIRFLTPTPTAECFTDPTSRVFCVQCKNLLTDDTVLTLHRPEIKSMQDGGSLCCACACACAPGWVQLVGDSRITATKPMDGAAESSEAAPVCLPEPMEALLFGHNVEEWNP